MEISIHAPHTGRDQPSLDWFETINVISIHAPHTGRDIVDNFAGGGGAIFQSTRPIRGATTSPPLRPYTPEISIHAPHTGRD